MNLLGTIESCVLRIRRRQNRFYTLLYNLARFTMTGIRIPVIKPIHLALYYIRSCIISIARLLLKILWWEPLFRSRCQKAGRNLSLPSGIPCVQGHVAILLGDNVTICRTTIGSSKVGHQPTLVIGNNSSIGS